MQGPIQIATTIALASAALGCSEYDRPPIREASEHLILRIPSELDVCGGTFSIMENEVIRIRELFGAMPGAVDYAWMPFSHYAPEDFPCTTIATNASGCASGLQVHDRAIANTHELVHAARAQIPVAFEEGLATLLGPPERRRVEPASRDELLNAMTGSWHLDESLYERAAHFVSYLIAAEGMDIFIEFDHRVRTIKDAYIAPFAQWSGTFEDVYDATFEEIWAGYAQYPDCPAVQFHLPLTACAALVEQAPEATLVTAWGEPGPDGSFLRSSSCEQDGVVGGEPVRWSTHVVELDILFAEAGGTGVTLIGEAASGTRAILSNCGDCWSGSAASVSTNEPFAFADLRSGPHALVLIQAIDEVGPVGIEIK